MVIVDFACRETEKIFGGVRSLVLAQDMQQVARRKLKYLHEARTLNDLRSPPGNRLEALKGSWKGKHSIRINDQWRICFQWIESNAQQVEIVDYH
jgi:proteic killer suppression protein